MKQVYVVFQTWYENEGGHGDIYNCDSMQKIFDSEDKAIAYIKDAFKAHHSWALSTYPDVDELKLYNSSMYHICAGEIVRVLDVWKDYGFSLAIHYRYEIYGVE